MNDSRSRTRLADDSGGVREGQGKRGTGGPCADSFAPPAKSFVHFRRVRLSSWRGGGLEGCEGSERRHGIGAGFNRRSHSASEEGGGEGKLIDVASLAQQFPRLLLRLFLSPHSATLRNRRRLLVLSKTAAELSTNHADNGLSVFPAVQRLLLGRVAQNHGPWSRTGAVGPEKGARGITPGPMTKAKGKAAGRGKLPRFR